MKESSRLLETTAADVMRHLSNADYGSAVEEILSLKTSIAAAYVVAVTVAGLKLPIAKALVREIAEVIDEDDIRNAIEGKEG